jgi:DNA-binding NtrC family response regulator
MAIGPMITPEDLELASSKWAVKQTLQQAKDNLEAEYIRKALTKHKGNVKRAAEEIGTSRPTFYDLMNKHQIDQSRYKGA